MKKCPYCGHMNDEENTVCGKCSAGFPYEETKKESPSPKVTKRNKKESE